MRLLRRFGRQDLDRDLAPQAQIVRQVHDAHATATDQPDDAVATDEFPLRQHHLPSMRSVEVERYLRSVVSLTS